MRRRTLLTAALLIPASSPRTEPSAPAVVEGAWSRPGPARTGTAVAYLRLRNAGTAPLRLVGGSTPLARAVEIHETSTEGGIALMRPRPDGVEVPPGGTVAFAPSGLHLMLIAPVRDLRAGDSFPVTLRFTDGSQVETIVAVTGRTPTAPDSADHRAH